MSKPTNLLNAQEFAKKAGVSSATVSKWLRNGTISGKKISGKWSISTAELNKVVPIDDSRSPNPPTSNDKKAQGLTKKPSGRSFTIAEFSAMTYLTEFGVRKWLQEGRLDKVMDVDGIDKVAGSNLENPLVKRLIR